MGHPPSLAVESDEVSIYIDPDTLREIADEIEEKGGTSRSMLDHMIGYEVEVSFSAAIDPEEG